MSFFIVTVSSRYREKLQPKSIALPKDKFEEAEKHNVRRKDLKFNK